MIWLLLRDNIFELLLSIFRNNVTDHDVVFALTIVDTVSTLSVSDISTWNAVKQNNIILNYTKWLSFSHYNCRHSKILNISAKYELHCIRQTLLDWHLLNSPRYYEVLNSKGT